MFLTENPVVGTYIKKQGSVNIPLYKTHIKNTTYSHIGKKAVNYGKEGQLPEIEKIASSPFDSFVKGPKKTKGAKWREEEISAERVLDSREQRLENVMGKSIQGLMNPVILDDNEYSVDVIDTLKSKADVLTPIENTKKQRRDSGSAFNSAMTGSTLDINNPRKLSIETIRRKPETKPKKPETKPKKPDFMEVESKQQKRKADAPLKLTKNKKVKVDTVKVAGEKRKAVNPLRLTKNKKVKQDITVAGEKRKKSQKTEEPKKKRKINPTNKRQGEKLENPKKKKKKIN